MLVPFLVAFLGYVLFALKRPVHSFVFLLFIYIIVPPTIAFPARIFGVDFTFTLGRLFFIGYILVFIINVLTKKNKFKLVQSSDDKIFILYISYTFISLFWGLNLGYDLKILISEQYLLGFVGYFIAANIFKDVRHIEILFKFLSLSVIILTLYGFIEIVTQSTISNLSFLRSIAGIDIDKTQFMEKSLGERGGFARPSGSFWHNIIYGIALTLFYPHFLLLRKFLKGNMNKIVIFISTIGALLTISRTAWFSMLYTFALNFRKYKILSIVGLIILFALLLPFLKSDFSKVGYLDNSGLSMASRMVVLIPVFVDLNFKDILLGFGVGSYYYSVANTVSLIDITRLPGDNTFAQRVFTSGLIGVVLFLLFFYRYFKNISKTITETNTIQSYLITATSQMILIQLTLFFVSNSLFQDPRLSFVFFAVLGSVKGFLFTKNKYLI